MERFRAAAQVAAFFLVAVCGSQQAWACEGCDRAGFVSADPVLSDPARDISRNIGRLDVTSAVDSATSFVIDALRGLRLFSRFGLARGAVDITQQDIDAAELQLYDDAYVDVIAADDELGSALTVAEYAADYNANDSQHAVEMPNFRRHYAWQLTYRSEPADTVWQPAPSERFPGMNITLDDSWVFGLRFEMDYGWKR